MKLKFKHEKNYEENMRKEEQEMFEKKEILEGRAELNLSTAKPSVYHAVNFLTNYFVRFLPTAVCLGCGEKLVQPLKKGARDEMRPERSYCGHWMHYKCFEEYVNKPPFKCICPAEGCNEFFGSKNFKLDEPTLKSREKAYMQAAEKKNEEDDLDRLLGLV